MDNLSFNAEIKVHITTEDYLLTGELTAIYAPLEIYLFGLNEDKLIYDMKLLILDMYDELTNTKDSQLSPKLVEQKKHLLEIITKNPN